MMKIAFSVATLWIGAAVTMVTAQDSSKRPMVPPLLDTEPAHKSVVPLSPIVRPVEKQEEQLKLPFPVPVPEPKRIIRVNDTNKPYDIIEVDGGAAPVPPGQRVAIGFFNHSERDLELMIGRQVLQLKSKHYVQIRLPRQFQWHESGRDVVQSVVPESAAGLEIVFRR